MPKNGEVIQLHVGQAGIQMANACWELYCLEHGITTKGHPKYPDCAWNTFFGVSSSGKIVPRLVMVDLEPTAIDEIRTGHYRQLFHSSTLITGKEDAASNFARGYYVLGKEIVDVTMDTIRKVAETCSKLDGFILYRSIGGGTGGGLGTLILEHLYADYGRTTKLEFEVFPSPTISPVIVEPYNAVLATHSSMNYCDCTFLVDNESLYDICAKRLDVPHPNYTNLNRLVGQILSSITAPLRFESKINVTFNDFKTNLVPYPRIHYPLVTYAPIIPGKKSSFAQITARQLTMECFEPANQMVKCNPRYGAYMACVLLYRGDIKVSDTNLAIQDIKKYKAINFVEWSPTGFKVGINNRPPTYVPGGDLAPLNKAVCMLSNNTTIREAWCRIIKKFNKMFQKRAFVHHYIGEGLEEDDLIEARDNLCSLIEDYMLVEGNNNTTRPKEVQNQ